MNSKTTILITSLLAFALLANVNNVGSVFATGGLDDEEEEEAIEELQNAVEELKGTLGTIELNLTEGSNDIQANCPSTEEIVQEVVQNITEQENNVTEQQPIITCPIVEEPEQNNQTVIPEPIQNETETGCNPIPELIVEENETQQSELAPIICPINGELLGYTNTTSGEQLPISAGNNTGFLPPIELPTEPEEPITPVQTNQTVTEQQLPTCNVTAQQPPSTIVPEINSSNPIEFEASCGCFVVDKLPQEVQ